MQLSVRNVDKKVFQEFKAQAIKEGLAIGEALTMAIDLWLQKEKVKKKSFLELKPIAWGKGTEKASTEIDKYLYGD